jgi:hypothetical protein
MMTDSEKAIELNLRLGNGRWSALATELKEDCMVPHEPSSLLAFESPEKSQPRGSSLLVAFRGRGLFVEQ